MKIQRLLAVLAAAFGLSAQAAQLTVTTLADSGPGSLRAQIAASHGTPGNTIVFAVTGKITLNSVIALQLEDNVTVDGGGAIVISGGSKTQIFTTTPFSFLTLRRLTITQGRATTTNTTDGFGGAIKNGGALTLDQVTMVDNSAVNGGGAIAHYTNDGSLTVTRSTFEGNHVDSSTGFGGAIVVGTISYATIINSTFVGNAAATGGAIANENGNKADIANSTFFGNLAKNGSALSVHGLGLDILKDDIFAFNLSRPMCALIPTPGSSVLPTYDNRGGNISFPDNTCPGTLADPRLGPLTNNGGPTATMALLPGSHAIDAAADCLDTNGHTVTTDQRGVSRPQGPRCDSGAFERSPVEFDQFVGEVSDPPRVNTEEAGELIQIRFRLESFAGMNIFQPGYPASQQISCATGSPIGAATPIAQSGNLTFDGFSRTYSVNWKTDKSWRNTCRQLVIRLTDGLDHPASFNFR
jgi:hypothetical protein